MKRGRHVWLAGLLALGISGAIGWRTYRRSAGEPAHEIADTWNQGHRIVDRDGRLLRELPSGIGGRGQPMPLDAMGDRLVVATLASEDKRFFEHSGVDGAAIVRAVGENARHARIVSGASTITQQLVKLLDTGGQPTRDGRTVDVKVREAARAQNLEERLTKKQILEAYLNRLNYGRNLIGPAAAAQAYYGVSPADLSWAQAAYMAVLPRAPSSFDPYDHPERGKRRQEALLRTLAEQGLISAADLERSLAEPVAPRPLVQPFEAPYLVESLRAGHLGGLSEGPVTETTIDLALQQDVEGLVENHGARLEAGHAAAAAVVIVDNDTAEVLAYVGGRVYGDGDSSMVDMARAPRQPGSALKPFVYALAFANGLQPSEMVADVPTELGEHGGAYTPGNFDGTFHGPVSAREALAGSLNIPAVRLAAERPSGELLSLLHDLGMASLDREASHYGLSLALGSGEVQLLELAGAYATVARGGEHAPLRLHRAPGPDPHRVIDAAVAAAIADTLSDPLARVRGLGGVGPFDIGIPVAVKTGTSSGYRDSWTVGFTRERTVAVWVGNPDGSPTAELTGGSGAGPLFADVMRLAMDGVATRRPLFDADLLEAVEVCPLSGLRAEPSCPERVMRRLIPGDHALGAHEPARCALHRHGHPQPTSTGAPPWRCHPQGKSTIVLLPDVFAGWLARQPLGAPGRDPHGLPWYAAGSVPGCSTSVSLTRLTIDEPAPGSVLLATEGARIEMAASLQGPTSPLDVEFVLDGQVVARSSAPYRANVPALPGDHELMVRPLSPTAEVRLAHVRFSVR